MTINELRKNPDYVKRMSEILSDPVMRMTVEALKQGAQPVDASVDSPEVASVRILSQTVGANYVIQELTRSGKTPEHRLADLGQEDYGVTEKTEA